jgi:hypothetical protein
MTLELLLNLILPLVWAAMLALFAWRFALRPLWRSTRWGLHRYQSRATGRLLRQPPPPDAVEVELATTSPYRHTALSEELTGVIAWMLWATGYAGLDPDAFARAAQVTDMETHHRSLARFRAIVDDLASIGIEDDHEATTWLMELSAKLHARTTHQ